MGAQAVREGTDMDESVGGLRGPGGGDFPRFRSGHAAGVESWRWLARGDDGRAIRRSRHVTASAAMCRVGFQLDVAGVAGRNHRMVSPCAGRPIRRACTVKE